MKYNSQAPMTKDQESDVSKKIGILIRSAKDVMPPGFDQDGMFKNKHRSPQVAAFMRGLERAACELFGKTRDSGWKRTAEVIRRINTGGKRHKAMLLEDGEADTK